MQVLQCKSQPNMLKANRLQCSSNLNMYHYYAGAGLLGKGTKVTRKSPDGPSPTSCIQGSHLPFRDSSLQASPMPERQPPNSALPITDNPNRQASPSPPQGKEKARRRSNRQPSPSDRPLTCDRRFCFSSPKVVGDDHKHGSRPKENRAKAHKSKHVRSKHSSHHHRHTKANRIHSRHHDKYATLHRARNSTGKPQRREGSLSALKGSALAALWGSEAAGQRHKDRLPPADESPSCSPQSQEQSQKEDQAAASRHPDLVGAVSISPRFCVQQQTAEQTAAARPSLNNTSDSFDQAYLFARAMPSSPHPVSQAQDMPDSPGQASPNAIAAPNSPYPNDWHQDSKHASSNRGPEQASPHACKHLNRMPFFMCGMHSSVVTDQGQGNSSAQQTSPNQANHMCTMISKQLPDTSQF